MTSAEDGQRRTHKPARSAFLTLVGKVTWILWVQLILLGVIGLLSWLYILGFAHYIAGRFASLYLFDLNMICDWPAIGIAVLCLVAQVFLLFAGPGERTGRLIGIRVGICLLSAVILFGSFSRFELWWRAYTEGFRDRAVSMHVQDNLPAIREWIAELSKTEEKGAMRELSLSECPPLIRRLAGPYTVYLQDRWGADGPVWVVMIHMGSGRIGAWSYVFGPADFRIPDEPAYGTVELVFQLGPGAYVCHKHSE